MWVTYKNKKRTPRLKGVLYILPLSKFEISKRRIRYSAVHTFNITAEFSFLWCYL